MNHDVLHRNPLGGGGDPHLSDTPSSPLTVLAVILFVLLLGAIIYFTCVR